MISLTKTPLKFSPAGNPIVFTVSGSSSNLLLFKAEVLETTTLTSVYTGNIFPTPVNPSQASVNLSNQLSSLVSPEPDNTSTLILGKSRPIIAYKLKTTEYGTSGGTLTALGTANTSNTFYAFDSELDIFNYTKRFTGNTYVTMTGNTAKFLTLQPDNKAVNDYSFEQLYFIQSGMSAVTLSVTVNGNLNIQHITGTNPYVKTPAIPETRSKGFLAITGSCAAGDNLGVYTNGNLLGAYTASTSGLTTSQLATNLASALSSNVSGYTISTTGNTIGIQAPAGLGSSGNSISLSAHVITTATTASTVTSETKAEVTIAGYTSVPDPYSDYTTVYLYEPPSSTYIELYHGIVFHDTTLNGFTAALVTELNINAYGYTAIQNASDSFIITARSGLGASMNGYPAYMYFDSTTELFVSYFGGGITNTTSGTTTNHFVIPNKITGFTGGINVTAEVTGYTLNDMLRIQTSPKQLKANSITGFTNGGTYSIKLKDDFGNVLTETKNYVYQDTDCNLEYVNIAFTNSIGGIDSYQFINPQQSLVITKLKVKKDNLNLDSSTPYLTNGIYNESDKTYHTSSKTNFKVYTKTLSDSESNWLTELVNSKNIWLELTDGNLLPIQLETSSYTIQKKKYTREDVNQYQFEFSLSDNYLPALANAGIVINA